MFSIQAIAVVPQGSSAIGLGGGISPRQEHCGKLLFCISVLFILGYA